MSEYDATWADRVFAGMTHRDLTDEEWAEHITEVKALRAALAAAEAERDDWKAMAGRRSNDYLEADAQMIDAFIERDEALERVRVLEEAAKEVCAIQPSVQRACSRVNSVDSANGESRQKATSALYLLDTTCAALRAALDPFKPMSEGPGDICE